jgi:hypothetical protein
MSGIEMLDENERHAAVGGDRTDELSASIQTAGRCTYAND